MDFRVVPRIALCPVVQRKFLRTFQRIYGFVCHIVITIAGIAVNKNVQRAKYAN